MSLLDLCRNYQAKFGEALEVVGEEQPKDKVAQIHVAPVDTEIAEPPAVDNVPAIQPKPVELKTAVQEAQHTKVAPPPRKNYVGSSFGMAIIRSNSPKFPSKTDALNPWILSNGVPIFSSRSNQNKRKLDISSPTSPAAASGNNADPTTAIPAAAIASEPDVLEMLTKKSSSGGSKRISADSVLHQIKNELSAERKLQSKLVDDIER